jgi:beta-barrel assembly-enhancing protease
MKTKLFIVSLFIGITSIMISCDEDGGINFFTVEQDIEFGEEFHLQLLANPAEYPLIDPSDAPTAYNHLERIRNALITSPNLKYGTKFSWDVYLIDNDSVLNAFCVPGGKMYFYTGLIKFLENEAQFAGVMAHEMAHADKRHSTKIMTKQYGFSLLLSAILGDDPDLLVGIAAELAQGLGSLYFSRDNEYEADEFAVKYTNDASGDNDFYPKGIAGFFEMMGTQTRSLEFLSTHPDPGNRVEAINTVWVSLGSPAGETYETRYQGFKASLP